MHSLSQYVIEAFATKFENEEVANYLIELVRDEVRDIVFDMLKRDKKDICIYKDVYVDYDENLKSLFESVFKELFKHPVDKPCTFYTIRKDLLLNQSETGINIELCKANISNIVKKFDKEFKQTHPEIVDTLKQYRVSGSYFQRIIDCFAQERTHQHDTLKSKYGDLSYYKGKNDLGNSRNAMSTGKGWTFFPLITIDRSGEATLWVSRLELIEPDYDELVPTED